MGCDIHYVIERKSPDHGWVGVCSTDYMLTTDYGQLNKYEPFSYKSRNYRFFGLLAGVRSDGGPAPKGLPEDMSALAATCTKNWEGDGHSHSYCSLKEFVAAHIDADLEINERVANKLQNIDLTREALKKLLWMDDDTDADNYRVVYWFDN